MHQTENIQTTLQYYISNLILASEFYCVISGITSASSWILQISITPLPTICRNLMRTDIFTIDFRTFYYFMSGSTTSLSLVRSAICNCPITSWRNFIISDKQLCIKNLILFDYIQTHDYFDFCTQHIILNVLLFYSDLLE